MSATLTEDKKAAKREAEAARRAEIKKVAEEFAAREAGDPGRLDADQRGRALSAPAGIRKETYRVFVVEGLSASEQSERAKAEREAKEASEKKTGRARVSKDPEAAALAVKAKESAPDLKSRFRPLEGRQLLDLFEIEKPKTGTIVVRRKKGDAEQFVSGDLKRFRDGGDFEKKGEVRAQLAKLGADTKLWGRKFAAFILAYAEEVVDGSR